MRIEPPDNQINDKKKAGKVKRKGKRTDSSEPYEQEWTGFIDVLGNIQLDQAEEDGKSQELFKEVEQELHESGFFKHAATRWLNLTEKYGKALTDKKNKTAEEKIQEAATKDTLDAMKKSLS